MRTNSQMNQVTQDIEGLKAFLEPLLTDSDPVVSWKVLDTLDFLNDWEADINAKVAIANLNKPSFTQRILTWIKGTQ